MTKISDLTNGPTLNATDRFAVTRDPTGTPTDRYTDGSAIGDLVVTTARVTATGALMDSEVTSLSGIKTITLPDNVTITAFAATLLDDATEAAMKVTLNLTIGTDVQAHSAVLDATTAAFTSALLSKLNGVEANATADQTGAEIKTAYEAEPSAFTDAQFTKLAGIETAATADQTGAEIKTAYEAEASAFTDAQFTKLANIAANATNNTGALADLDTVGTTQIDNLSVTVGKLASLSSADLQGKLTDETGSGSVVFSTSPTLVTPALGTPASGVLTNCTGTAAGLTAGGVTTNANLTGAITSVGNATSLGTFTAAQLDTAMTGLTLPASGTLLSESVTDTLNVGYAHAVHALGTITTGTVTPDEGNGQMQSYTNNGAHTLAPPGNSTSLVIQMTNAASAGAITTSGFTSVGGDTLTTTNGDDFLFYITKVGTFSHLAVHALQ